MPKQEIINDVESFTLPSGIAVETQEITGASERLMMNRQAVKSGRWLNKFILNALVSYDGKPLPENEGEAINLLLDMKVGDRNFLILKIRMQSYGTEMVFNQKCPECGATFGYQMDLQEMLDKGDLKVYPYRQDVPIAVETRDGIAEVNYMTGRTEQWLGSLKEIDTVSLAVAGCSAFDGHAPTVKDFEKLRVKDLTKIRQTFMSLKGGLDPNIELECLECGNNYSIPIYSISDFFSPLTSLETIGI